MDNELYQKKVLRELSDIKQYLELIYKEREVMEDNQSATVALGNKIVTNQLHQDNIAKDIKKDIGDVQSIVEAKIDEVHENIDNKTVVVKSGNVSIIEKVKKLFKKKW